MDRQSTILIVDDTPSNLDLLREILSDDYRVRVAIDGEKALELALRDPLPDIILLDIMMPGMDGYEVCQRLKQHADTMPIPVIFVTAMAQVEDEQRGLALGAVDYITKPYDPDIVKARVRTQLTQYQTTRQLIAENRELRDIKGRAFTDFDQDTLADLLAQGEGNRLEFKSTLRWNLFADKSDKAIENACLKAVAGYLNADGGILLVGVNDDGEVLGLGNDHFKNEDKFLLHWVNLLKSYLGAEFIPFVRSIAHDVDGGRVLVVECLPSTKPAFFRRDNEESFFVRMSNSTQALKPSEVLAYIEQHFGKNQPDLYSAKSGAQRRRENAEELTSMGFAGWIEQLRERRVFRTAALYLASAWAITEVGTTAAEAFEAPGWIRRAILYAFIGGFPIVILLSWAYDLRIIREKRLAPLGGRKMTTWLIVATAIVVAAAAWRIFD